jgi:outer membrane protein assembly factor BamB
VRRVQWPCHVATVCICAGLTVCTHVSAMSPGPPPTLLQPVCSDGVVYVAFAPGEELTASSVAAYDLAQGHPVWQRSVSAGTGIGTGLHVDGDRLYVPLAYDAVYALGAQDGKTIGKVAEGHTGEWNVVASTGDYIVVTASDGRNTEMLVAYDKRTLHKAWTHAFEPNWSVVWAAQDGPRLGVLIGSAARMGSLGPFRLVRLRQQDGEVASTEATEPTPEQAPATVPPSLPPGARATLSRLVDRDPGRIGRTEIVAVDGTFLVGLHQARENGVDTLYAVRGSGRIAWQRTLPGLAHIARCPTGIVVAYGDRSVYAALRPKILALLSASTGVAVWSATLAGTEVASSAAFAVPEPPQAAAPRVHRSLISAGAALVAAAALLVLGWMWAARRSHPS